MSAVNAQPATQPAVRSGSLPTTTPRGVAPAPQAAPAAEGTQEAAPAEGAPADTTATEKPKRKPYNRRKKAQMIGGVELSRDEEAAWGRLSLKAANKGISVERYVKDVVGDIEQEIAVFRKLFPNAAETAAESATVAEA